MPHTAVLLDKGASELVAKSQSHRCPAKSQIAVWGGLNFIVLLKGRRQVVALFLLDPCLGHILARFHPFDPLLPLRAHPLLAPCSGVYTDIMFCIVAHFFKLLSVRTERAA